MTPGRMPGNMNVVLVTAEGGGVVIGPGDGGPALANQFGHIDGRDQGVIDDDEGCTPGGQPPGQKAKVVFVAGKPIAAMQKDIDRHPTIGDSVFRQIDIQRFFGASAEGNVEAGLDFCQHGLSPCGAGLVDFRMVGNVAAVVVLGIQFGLVVVS